MQGSLLHIQTMHHYHPFENLQQNRQSTIHSYLLHPTRHKNFPRQKSLNSQVICTVLQKITKLLQENKEKEGVKALTQK